MKKLILLFAILAQFAWGQYDWTPPTLTVSETAYNVDVDDNLYDQLEELSLPPVLATTYLQWITTQSPWLGYGVVRYSGDNNRLRQMSIVTAVNGVVPDRQTFFSDLSGEHIITIAEDVGLYDVSVSSLENSTKRNVRVNIYDCEANRPLPDPLTYTISGTTLTLDINTLPDNITSWSFFGSITNGDTTTHLDYNNRGTYSYSTTVSGTQSPWQTGLWDPSTFPSFELPEGRFEHEPQFSFNTGICGYGGLLRNSNPPEVHTNWVETRFGIWTNVDFPGYELNSLRSYQANNWTITITRNGEHVSTYSHYFSYTFNHFLERISNYIRELDD